MSYLQKTVVEYREKLFFISHHSMLRPFTLFYIGYNIVYNSVLEPLYSILEPVVRDWRPPLSPQVTQENMHTEVKLNFDFNTFKSFLSEEYLSQSNSLEL